MKFVEFDAPILGERDTFIFPHKAGRSIFPNCSLLIKYFLSSLNAGKYSYFLTSKRFNPSYYLSLEMRMVKIEGRCKIDKKSSKEDGFLQKLI